MRAYREQVHDMCATVFPISSINSSRGSSIRRKETVIKGDKIERRRSDANSSVVATTKEKYGMLNSDM